ncbi:MAG: virulence RhuM family protein [Pedobacter sp.]|nr:virulence RhuM family protein [Pedobacter sp.]
MDSLSQESEFIFYTTPDGKVNVPVIVGEDTIWTNQRKIADIFGVEVPNISKHIANIFEEGELDKNATVSKMEIVQQEGERSVKRTVDFYNLDVILSVGYRVNSYQATQFRVWANKILKEYLIKGFAMDDQRLKQGKKMFGKDYFDELLQRIKEIRASERRFYQKITDIYAQCSLDYDPKSPITQTFFATVQNKLEFAITHMTGAAIIKSRANANEPHMGLQTWANSPNGKVLKKDITVAKNYLKQAEMDELNSIVVMYLDYAELQAKRNRAMKMADWVDRLDLFLQFNEYDILKDAGKIRKSFADSCAEKQYEKFRVIQDREYKSDFDKVVEVIKTRGELPKESEIKNDAIEEYPLSEFNQKLKTALNYDPKEKKTE